MQLPVVIKGALNELLADGWPATTRGTDSGPTALGADNELSRAARMANNVVDKAPSMTSDPLG